MATQEGESLAEYLMEHVEGFDYPSICRMRWWIERMLGGGMPTDAVEFVVRELAKHAADKKKPVAWSIWCTKQAGFPWIPDIDWDRRKPRRKSGGMASIDELLDRT